MPTGCGSSYKPMSSPHGCEDNVSPWTSVLDDRLVCDSPALLSLQRLEETGPERGETSWYPWPCPQAPQTGALPQPTPHHDPGQMLSENHNYWPERWSLDHVGIVSWWHLVVKQNINYPKIPPVAAFRLRTTWCHLSLSTWVNSHLAPSLLRGTSSRPVDRGTYRVQWTTFNHKSKQTLPRSDWPQNSINFH